MLVKVLQQGPKCLYDPEAKKFMYGVKPARVKKHWVIKSTPWYTHPACRMWLGYEASLKVYCNHMLQAIVKYDTAIMEFNGYDIVERFVAPVVHPPWLGDELFHSSHKSNLLRKDPGFYGQYCWKVPLDLDYVWPLPQDYISGGLFS